VPISNNGQNAAWLDSLAMQQSTTFQRWLSITQAGHYSGLTDRTLRNYEGAGLLKFHRIIQPGATRGTVRIDRLKLDALIEKSVAPASSLKMNEGRNLASSTGGNL
jgi:hypothetical protein